MKEKENKMAVMPVKRLLVTMGVPMILSMMLFGTVFLEVLAAPPSHPLVESLRRILPLRYCGSCQRMLL